MNWLTLFRTAVLIFVIAGFAWIWWRALQRTDDQKAFLVRWLFTVPILGVLIFVVAPLVGRGGVWAAFGGIPAVLALGFVIAAMWRQALISIVSNAVGSLYDGGSQQIDAKPLYSIAISRRKRGNYQEAIEEIRKQLHRFPTDFEGQLLIAEIQAENLNDMQAAEMTVERIVQQPGHAPGSVALALNWLADWHLKYTRDAEAAQLALEKIRFLLPDTEFSSLAAQRIAHLMGPESPVTQEAKKFVVSEGVKDLGLLDPKFHPKPAEPDAARQAAELVAHLREHPLDTDARERLAVLYADQYGRLDLAADQLEDLIKLPNQPAKRVVHWLNVLADLQIRHGIEYESVRATLQRIADLFPNSAASQLAQNRIAHLRLGMKRNEQQPQVRMGTYEQDIGLKGGRLPDQF
jgi:outer membrane protein assembly factor BamD (BamD/ComL family)